MVRRTTSHNKVNDLMILSVSNFGVAGHSLHTTNVIPKYHEGVPGRNCEIRIDAVQIAWKRFVAVQTQLDVALIPNQLPPEITQVRDQ